MPTMRNKMRSGSYVKFTRLVDYAPYTLITDGEIGRVVFDDPEGTLIIELMRTHHGLGEGNKVTLVLNDRDAVELTRSPVIVRRVCVGASTAALAALVLLMVPHVQIDNWPGPKLSRSAELAEQTYLREGPPSVTRLNKMMDGTYELGIWSHPRPGLRYGEQVYKRIIPPEDVEEELRKLGDD